MARSGGWRRWGFALGLLALHLAATAGHAQRAGTDSLKLTFFDVGQGDAALITTSEGKRVLIDAGPGGAHLVPQLTALGVTTLDLVVATHNHADHIGGMADVLGAFTVREYVDNGLPALTSVYRRTVDAVEQHHKNLTIRPAGWQRYRLGRVTVHMMAPPRGDESQNDNSIGLRIEFGRFNALFTGDAENLELEWWRGTILKWPSPSVVKASHHGSANGVTEWWMDLLKPKVVVISVGANNQYGHPSRDVLLGWSAGGARVYRTDGFGTITITAAADGGFVVRTERNDSPWTSK
jgi:competence protein ComEC